MFYSLLGGAPWLNLDQSDKKLLINRYVANYWLPGRLFVGIILSSCLRSNFACFDGDLFINQLSPHDVVCGIFVRRAMDGFDSLKTYIPVPQAHSGIFI